MLEDEKFLIQEVQKGEGRSVAQSIQGLSFKGRQRWLVATRSEVGAGQTKIALLIAAGIVIGGALFFGLRSRNSDNLAFSPVATPTMTLYSREVMPGEPSILPVPNLSGMPREATATPQSLDSIRSATPVPGPDISETLSRRYMTKDGVITLGRSLFVTYCPAVESLSYRVSYTAPISGYGFWETSGQLIDDQFPDSHGRRPDKPVGLNAFISAAQPNGVYDWRAAIDCLDVDGLQIAREFVDYRVTVTD